MYGNLVWVHLICCYVLCHSNSFTLKLNFTWGRFGNNHTKCRAIELKATEMHCDRKIHASNCFLMASNSASAFCSFYMFLWTQPDIAYFSALIVCCWATLGLTTTERRGNEARHKALSFCLRLYWYSLEVEWRWNAGEKSIISLKKIKNI